MMNSQSCNAAGTGNACPNSGLSVSTAIQAANDAFDLLRATQERLDQMTAVVQSIKTDWSHNESRNIKVLAELGAFLGYDWSGYIDGRVTEMQTHLDEMGLSA